jgi:hypothetical protein
LGQPDGSPSYVGWVPSLEPTIVDHIDARALDPESLPLPEPRDPPVATETAKLEEDCKDQAHSLDDVADPARKLVVHSRGLPNKKPATKGGSVNSAAWQDT